MLQVYCLEQQSRQLLLIFLIMLLNPGLKTYSIFDAIRSVSNKNTKMLGGSLEKKEKARRLITQTINCLTAKMEIGGPMASLYLLGNPDHYTSRGLYPPP